MRTDNQNMTALMYVQSLGRATGCENTTHHAPNPARFVWHHVLPQSCGGKTEPGNLVSLCDNCHYTVHAMMYWMRKHDGKLHSRYSPKLRALARTGYQDAVTAGTVDFLPDEGGSVE